LFRQLRALARTLASDLTSPWFLGALAGLSFLIILLEVQYAAYRYSPLLGWDSWSYVSQARHFLALGPIGFSSEEGYPLLYVQLLGTASWLDGNLYLTEEVLPVILIGLYLVVVGALSSKLFAHSWQKFFAPLVTGTAVTTMILESDLNRTVLTLVLTWAIILLVTKEGRILFRGTSSAIMVVLFLAAMFTEVETLVVMILALGLYGVIWNRRVLRDLVVLSVVAGILLLIISPGFIFGYGAQAAQYSSAALTISSGDVAIYYAGAIVLLPLAGFGTWIALRSKANPVAERGGRITAVYALICLGLAGLFIAHVVRLPPERPLFLVPTGLLLTFTAGYIADYSPPPSGNPEAARRSALSAASAQLPRSSSGRYQMVLVILVGVGIVSATAVQSLQATDGWDVPFLSQSAYTTIQEAAQIARTHGVGSVLVPLQSASSMWFWELYSFEISGLLPSAYIVYGDLHYTLAGLDPAKYEPFPILGAEYQQLQIDAASSTYESAIQVASAHEVSLSNLPVLIVTPLLYVPMYMNLSRSPYSSYEYAPGIYLFPAGFFGSTWQNHWILTSNSSWTSTNPFWSAPEPWSVSGTAITYVNLSEGANARLSFPFATNSSVSAVSATVYFMDFAPRWNSSYAPYAPLEFEIDGNELGGLSYSNLGATNITFGYDQLSEGTHSFSIASGQVNRTVIISVAEISLTFSQPT
jgi:hypothetical protein